MSNVERLRTEFETMTDLVERGMRILDAPSETLEKGPDLFPNRDDFKSLETAGPQLLDDPSKPANR